VPSTTTYWTLKERLHFVRSPSNLAAPTSVTGTITQEGNWQARVVPKAPWCRVATYNAVAVTLSWQNNLKCYYAMRYNDPPGEAARNQVNVDWESFKP
jgi:hypothetical protein